MCSRWVIWGRCCVRSSSNFFSTWGGILPACLHYRAPAAHLSNLPAADNLVHPSACTHVVWCLSCFLWLHLVLGWYLSLLLLRVLLCVAACRALNLVTCSAAPATYWSHWLLLHLFLLLVCVCFCYWLVFVPAIGLCLFLLLVCVCSCVGACFPGSCCGVDPVCSLPQLRQLLFWWIPRCSCHWGLTNTPITFSNTVS